MNKVFYWVAVIVAVVLLALGVLASRKTPTQTNNGGESFNADQLQDAAEKTPATN